MFDALADEPVVVAKPAAAPDATQSKTASKSLVGGVKKGDAPKRDSQASSSVSTTHGKLPGEVRKETGKGRHKQHVVRTDASGKIHGREFERHSQTGRPAVGENKRSGAGRNNWGALKDAKEDEDMAAAAAAAPETTEGAATVTDAPVEGAAESSETKVEAEPEPQTQSLASYRAEKAKKDKELEASLGLAPLAEAREIKSSWYKPAEKQAAPKAASSSSAPKDTKQQKTFVPISQIIGEKKEFRGEDRRGPRRDGGDRQPREGGDRHPREGGDRQHKPRDGNRQGAQGGRGGNRGGKKSDRPTFDATAGADKLPSLGQ